MSDQERSTDPHWFDRFTYRLAAKQLSRRSAVQAALSLAFAGAAWAEERTERGAAAPPGRGGRPKPPAVPTRPPPVRGNPPVHEIAPPVVHEAQPPPPVSETNPAPPQRTPPAPATPGSCVAQLTGQRGLTLDIAEQTTFQGKPLALRVTSSRNDAGTLVIGASVQQDGQPALQIRGSSATRGTARIDLQILLGAAFQGPNDISLTSDDGRMVRGTIDGRRLLPFTVNTPASGLRFADDGALPAPKPLPSGLGAAVEQLAARARGIASTCKPPPTKGRTPRPRGGGKGGGGGGGNPGGGGGTGTGTNSSSDPGDIPTRSPPWTSQACDDCYTGCDVAGGISILGDIVSFFGGPAAGVGAIVSTTAAYAFCSNACARGACCPVVCSENPIPPGITTPAVDPPCCYADEICINKHTGWCCPQADSNCKDTYCCPPGDICLGDGCCPSPRLCNNSTTCCPPNSVCSPDNDGNPNPKGHLCCAVGVVSCKDVCCMDERYTCRNGVCCLPDHECGDTCCDELSKCVNNSCCSFTQTQCGSACCNAGQVCLNNNTCCNPAQVCKLADGSSLCCPPNHKCDTLTHTCVSCPAGQQPCSPDNHYPPNQPIDVLTANQNLCCPEGHACCNGACCPDKNQICCQPNHGLGQTNGQFGCNLSNYCIS